MCFNSSLVTPDHGHGYALRIASTANVLNFSWLREGWLKLLLGNVASVK